MAGQIEGDRAVPLGESRLVEHPSIEIGAETMDEDDRRAVAAAQFQITQPFAAGVDLARGRTFGRAFNVVGDLGHDEAGDKRVDIGIGRPGGRQHRE